MMWVAQYFNPKRGISIFLTLSLLVLSGCREKEVVQPLPTPTPAPAPTPAPTPSPSKEFESYLTINSISIAPVITSEVSEEILTYED